PGASLPLLLLLLPQPLKGPRFQFVWKGKTGSSQQQMGGKCSKDPKCCATHVHTSKSLNPHRVLVTNLPPAGLYTEDFPERKPPQKEAAVRPALL
uniref:Uncharacterized protein n=1 Tax=Anser brachyrhynchus TaxID=132585 RepID=A0A8B9I141_9AVES